MKRRTFVKSSLLGTSVAASGFTFPVLNSQVGEKEIIELREYRLVSKSSQPSLDKYLQEALIPALYKYGVSKVGAFNENEEGETIKLYLLIAYPSTADYFKIPAMISSDNAYQKASKEYHSIPEDNMVFDRIDVKLMDAFDGMPKLDSGYPKSGLFEIRSYQGYNEDAVRRKVKMFNDVEIDIFKNTNFNAVFYGEEIAGKDLPCLTYMLAFRDMEERGERWKGFQSDPTWKRVRNLPEYANTVSNITQIFLKPLPYSQL